ncbi:MAG TPA: hypothetical protein VHW47_00235 [Acidimicrobiales bacterium]|jgi:hypothetical protein|nr:hypothetical protein [Acidimicrobiales bacterium]
MPSFVETGAALDVVPLDARYPGTGATGSAVQPRTTILPRHRRRV